MESMNGRIHNRRATLTKALKAGFTRGTGKKNIASGRRREQNRSEGSREGNEKTSWRDRKRYRSVTYFQESGVAAHMSKEA